jgi:hypothetical protein
MMVAGFWWASRGAFFIQIPAGNDTGLMMIMMMIMMMIRRTGLRRSVM